MVRRLSPIINQFAIVDTNYTPSGKVNHLTWFDLQQLRTIIFIYYTETCHLFGLLATITYALGGCVIIQEQYVVLHMWSFFPLCL